LIPRSGKQEGVLTLRRLCKAVLAFSIVPGVLVFDDDLGFVTAAQAVIGRPFTPLSVAGVARRNTRRAYRSYYYGGAAVAAGAAAGAYYYGGGYPYQYSGSSYYPYGGSSYPYQYGYGGYGYPYQYGGYHQYGGYGYPYRY
jgi:hypothetical protein